MKVIIKSRKHLKIEPALEEYAREKFGRLSMFLPEEPTIIEVEFADTRGPKGGLDKVIDLTISMPHQKQPFHLSEAKTDFREAIDIIKERAEKYLERLKEKKEAHRSH